MATSGQTLNDRINAARYALAGQGLARCVCKSTTEEIIGPKKKHLDYLIACTHEPNVSIPQLANLLIERTNHIYWVVVFKALVTVHHLMSYGNERFTQYLASSNYSFELSTFLDKTAARDFSMSTFIRRYSRYINEKALSYRLLAFDFCKVKRGNEGVLRIMPIDRLLKTLPILQNQLDALLEFDCSANDLNNGVINACFMLLFRDLIGLFACHNDGIINLLNKYFTLNRKMCREAFDLYKKFLVRMDKVSDFLRVAEVVGIDKDEIPDLRRAPSSLIDALEQHLQNIESNKKLLKQQSSIGTTNNNSNSNGGNGKTPASEGFSALGNLTPPSSRRPNSPSASGSGATSSQNDEFPTITSFKDDEVRKALEEEARVLSQYGTTEGGGSRTSKSKSGPSSTSDAFAATKATGGDSSSPKFAVSSSSNVKIIDDIFGDADSFNTMPSNNNNNSTSLHNNNGLDNGNASAFDNLSTASSSSSTNKHHRPDLSSIKSAIQSATTTLEKSSNAAAAAAIKLDSKPPGSKKASDDLFALLDTSNNLNNPSNLATVQNPLGSATNTSTLIGGKQSSIGSAFGPTPLGGSNMSGPFNPSPFVMATTNGQSSSLSAAPLKPGNPFPERGNDFASSAVFPNTTNPLSQPAANNSVFKSGTSTANYTNLGGLEGFGDLLQPTGTSNRGGATSGNHAYGATKSSFGAGPGLSNTGLFKGDLDTTLANLAQNLTFDGINKNKK